MMKSVSSLVVRANATEVRQLCAQALVQFLLDYPLGMAHLIMLGTSSIALISLVFGVNSEPSLISNRRAVLPMETSTPNPNCHCTR
jgi:hypothetical protein